MASVFVERLDPSGLMASAIQDFGLMAMIDARLGADEPEEITPAKRWLA